MFDSCFMYSMTLFQLILGEIGGERRERWGDEDARK